MFVSKPDGKKAFDFPKLRFPEYSNDLNTIKLKDISTFRRGRAVLKNVIDNVNGKYDCIHYADLSRKLKPLSNELFSKTNENNGVYTTGNELLINYGGYYNSFSWVSVKKSGIRVGREICLIKIPDNINSDYLSIVLNSKKHIKKINDLTEGIIARQLPVEYILNLNFSITKNISEQNKIAKFFTLIFKQIEIQRNISNNYKKFFKFFVSNPIKRFSIKKINKVFMKNIIVEVKVYNENKEVKNILSLSKFYGFIPKNEFFKHRKTWSNDISKYKIISKGNFGYNAMAGENIDIIRLYGHKKGLISPEYVIFDVVNNLFSPEYINYFFKSKIFAFYLKKELRGGIRQRLLFNSLKNIKGDFPSIENQKYIANFLEMLEKILKKQEKIEEMLTKRMTFLLNSISN